MYYIFFISVFPELLILSDFFLESVQHFLLPSFILGIRWALMALVILMQVESCHISLAHAAYHKTSSKVKQYT